MSWLTVKIGRFIHNALMEAKKAKDKASEAMPNPAESPLVTAIGHSSPALDGQPETSFSVIKCTNGKLLKVSEFKPVKGPGPDWKHELYIVKDDEKVPDVIARIMAIKALEQ